MQRRLSRCVSRAIFLSSATFIAIVHAETLSYGVDAGIGETDNVALAHEGRLSQTIAVTDFDLDYQRQSQRLDVDAKGDFSYLDYLQKAYGNQLLGRFDGRADVALLPQQLTWALQDDFGQSAINPFTPTSPSNLENINVFSTGPELHLRLSGAGFLDFTARAIRTQYETTPISNNRFTGGVGCGVNLSALSSLSVNGDFERVLFENTTLNTDFDRTHVFMRYGLQGARTDLSADLGVTTVGERGESTVGALARFKVARKLSVSSRLSIALGRELIDSGTSFSALQAGATGVVGTAPAAQTSENYTSNYASVDWEYQRRRTTLALSGRWERDDYAGEPTLDRTLATGEIRLQRQLTRAFALQATGRVYRSDYVNATAVGMTGSPNNITNSIAAAVIWRHGRALEVKLSLEHTNYSTSPNDTGYRESRGFVTVGYRPFNAPANNEEPSNL